MHVFVPGGTGTIGSAVVHSLLSSSPRHTVAVLSRHPPQSGGDGAEYITGDISDLPLLRTQAARADVVVYCAFDHSQSWEQQSAMETAAITAICETLSSSASSDALGRRPKVLVYCTVPMTSFPHSPDSPATEESPLVNYTYRNKTDEVVAQFSTAPGEGKGAGVRGVQLRLPMVVHTSTSPAPFLEAFKADDHIRVYGEGENGWPAINAADVGQLVAKLLEHEEKVPSGKCSAVHALAETVSTRDIAKAISETSGLPVRKLDRKELDEVGGLWMFILPASPSVSNKWTKETFAWEPRGSSLLEDIRTGGFFKQA